MEDNHSCLVNDRIRNLYESISYKIKEKFSNSCFWEEFIESRVSYTQKYYLETDYYLFSSDKSPELLVKSFDSFLLKTFRKNVINNINWPEPPSNGWLIPDSCHSNINDIVRTSLVMKYLDGVSFLVNELSDLTTKHGLNPSVDFEAKDDGYYAAHFYINFE